MIFQKPIIAIDLETTDSNSKIGSVIQISALYLDKEFNIIDEFDSYVKPLDSYRNPEAMAVNNISEDILATAMPLNDVLEMFESFTGKDIIISSWPNYFDIPFLRGQYEKINRKWIYGHRSLCLKSIAIWELAKQNLNIKGGVSGVIKGLGEEFKGKKHNALDDIKNTIRILQILKGR